MLFALALCEVIFRVLEHRENAQVIYEGEGGKWIDDPRWGWKPAPGPFRSATPEFDVTGNINSLFMNDVPYDQNEDAGVTRVLVLGDSHTFAVGASMSKTWGKVLEAKLNEKHSRKAFRIYNGGVSGFNMHQYLLRLKDQGPMLRPHYVVIGLSYATDFYDLLPPNHGGWIYGGDRARDYFDFDEKGTLTVRHWVSKKGKEAGSQHTTTAAGVRQVLEHFATFRYLRRSTLALFIGSHVRVGGQSLWPNMDIILEKNVTEKHQYQWRLFESLLSEMKNECDREGAKLIVVGIPYLPQVYDDLWNSTFGKDPRYSRTAAIERVDDYCRKSGITYLDSLSGFQSKNKELGRWLHHPKDGHPTAEGQEVIADQVMKAESLQVANTELANASRK